MKECVCVGECAAWASLAPPVGAPPCGVARKTGIEGALRASRTNAWGWDSAGSRAARAVRGWLGWLEDWLVVGRARLLARRVGRVRKTSWV